MTVRITYNQGFFDDCTDPDVATNWTETEDGDTATISCDDGDVYNINVTVAAGNKTVKYSYDMTNISSDTYTNFLARYKTSSSTIKAKIVLVFTVGSQTVLDEDDSTTWTTVQTAVTAGKTIDKIELWATQDTGDVYFDFAMIFQDVFAFPNTAFGFHFDPNPTQAIISIPGKTTAITQSTGSDGALVTCGCDLDQGTWTCTGCTEYAGELFNEMAHKATTYPWQWLDTGTFQFKVTVHPKFVWENTGDTVVNRLDLEMREYSIMDVSYSSFSQNERFGVGLTALS